MSKKLYIQIPDYAEQGGNLQTSPTSNVCSQQPGNVALVSASTVLNATAFVTAFIATAARGGMDESALAIVGSFYAVSQLCLIKPIREAAYEHYSAAKKLAQGLAPSLIASGVTAAVYGLNKLGVFGPLNQTTNLFQASTCVSIGLGLGTIATAVSGYIAIDQVPPPAHSGPRSGG